MMDIKQYRKNRRKYFKQYQWSNIAAMLRNNKKNPKICEQDAKGKLVVITGATSGIGYLVAKQYAQQGADLLCVNRNTQKSETLAKEIIETYHVKCDYFIADLSRMKDVDALVNHLLALDRPIDVLIHNAGVYLTKKEVTEDGFEKVFMVHYLSSFIINYKLAEKLKAQDNARIIIVNSEGHRFAAWGLRLDDLCFEKRRYSGMKSYGSAKLAQLLSMLVFDEMFQGSGVRINAMHPGAVKTDTGQENGRIYKWYKRNILDKRLKPASISADALYYLGISPEVENVSGKFFNLTCIEEPTPPALDREVATQLWEQSLQLAGIKE